tara:strand:+ start:208 stop:600 length:393 start_codon:yes stop_codon:yes gene_type:complete
MDYGSLVLICLLCFGFSIILFILCLNRIKQLESNHKRSAKSANIFLTNLSENDTLTNRRIDNEIHRVNGISTTDTKFTIHQIELVKKLIDELERKFKDKITSGVEVRDALNEINKVKSDLEDFVRMYRNQ